ncbi:hypothetical protein BB559_000856 [Furculomyces boomerangus]|uniref:peptidylprolyl isomerase n=1 Tax=Furculomyces boomerangus TaxID=61424 RepID=A0A2T9Z3V6_9FUNG|nr:hypothetical protein BB559_000856 [Furculomyces boomerangus]
MESSKRDISPATSEHAPPKKLKVSKSNQLYLDRIPSSETYTKSYMHRDTLSFVLVTKSDFLVTTSADGHVKFWKKKDKGIEFVKNYKAHTMPIAGIASTPDGLYLATISLDKTLKIFDVENFDMINIVKFDFVPSCVSWAYEKDACGWIVLVGDTSSGNIYGYTLEGTKFETYSDIHKYPVNAIAYNQKYDVVVSSDKNGVIEYWHTKTDSSNLHLKNVAWKYKTETDLYTFQKTKSVPYSIEISPSNELFVVMSSDSFVRVFNFQTGKITNSFDESLSTVQMVDGIDEMEFGRKLAIERELLKSPYVHNSRAIFDESMHFLLYPTIFGIKVVDLDTNLDVRLIGLPEPHRFVNIAMWQQFSSSKSKTADTVASSNPLIQSNLGEPTLFCTAYKQNRFYLFSQPDIDVDDADRDVFNEKPTLEEQKLAVESVESALSESAILRTTKGDIHLQLYPSKAPKAVENFCGLAAKGYYDGVIFHRVIKNFMIQTGDPLGDGTGGESLWGSEFADEFSNDLKHDKPFVLSMANAGPNTNGSQFFITTVPAPWLDNKHTIYGRVVSGMDVVLSIEKVRVDKNDKPLQDISIINVEIPKKKNF